MPERSTIAQVLQLGVESTPGTAVAATQKLQSLTIEPGIKTNVNTYRPMGAKYPTVSAQGKEWTEAKLGGAPVYSELIYPLASVIDTPTIAQQAATTAYKHTFISDATSEDAPKTFTIEQGSSVRAHEFSYGLVTEFGWTGDRDKIELNGQMIGQAITDGITMTPALTGLELIPVLPKTVDCWIDTTSGGLGTTKLTRLLKYGFKIGNRYSPLWAVNSANGSWVAHVETAPVVEIKLLVEADAAGMAYLTTLRDSSTKFLRWKATDANMAGTAIPYSWTCDFAAKIVNVNPWEDSDGVFAIEYTLLSHYDATWTKAFDIQVINKQTAL